MNKRDGVLPQPKSRRELEAEFGMVWDTRQLARAFVVTSIIPPDTIVVRRKADGVVGTMRFQNGMRYYFQFVAAPASDFFAEV